MIKLLSTPEDLGITVAEAKEFMRVEFNDDDELISDMIKAATNMVQSFTSQQITSAQYSVASRYFEQEKALKSPVVSIDSIEYYDENNTLQTLDPSYYYLIDFGLPHKLYYVNDFSEPTLFNRPDAVIINFTCGMTTVPSDIKSWIKIKVSTLYEYREQFYLSNVQISKLDDEYLRQFLWQHKVNL